MSATRNADGPMSTPRRPAPKSSGTPMMVTLRDIRPTYHAVDLRHTRRHTPMASGTFPAGGAMSSRSTLLTAVIAIAAGSVSAQVPLGSAFTYQGRLSDGGSPASGSYDFEFRLFNGPNGGTAIGPTVSLGTVAVTSGLFSVTLDFGTSPNP